MKKLLLFSIFFLSQQLHAEIKGYIAPAISLGYSLQNQESTIDSVVDKSQMGAFTYAVGVSLIRKGSFAGVKYQNVDFDELHHNYFLFNLGTTFGTVSDDTMGFGIQIALGWDDYKWQEIPSPVNKYSSMYDGASFAYGFGINYYYKLWKNLIFQIEYEAIASNNNTADLVQTLETDPKGEIWFGFNSSFLFTVNYGFGVGRYEAPKKNQEDEKEEEAPKNEPVKGGAK